MRKTIDRLTAERGNPTPIEINMFEEILPRLLQRRDLSAGEAEAVFLEVMGGQLSPVQIAALLVALRTKGETVEEITGAGWYRKIAQAFGVLLPVASVGVMGDGRSYSDQNVIVVRFVESKDFMTADWVPIDPSVLAAISTRITNEVPGVNRVVYDITSKPPATIEWE